MSERVTRYGERIRQTRKLLQEMILRFENEIIEAGIYTAYFTVIPAHAQIKKARKLQRRYGPVFRTMMRVKG